MTYDEFAKIAMSFGDVSEKAGKYEVDLFRGKDHFARLCSNGTILAIRVDWPSHDRFLADPRFFKTTHYKNHPYVLIKVENLDEGLANDLIKIAWHWAPASIPLREN